MLMNVVNTIPYFMALPPRAWGSFTDPQAMPYDTLIAIRIATIASGTGIIVLYASLPARPFYIIAIGIARVVRPTPAIIATGAVYQNAT